MHITTDGQLTIPQRIREKLDLTPNTEVEFLEENGRFYVIKIPVLPRDSSPFRRLRGVATVKMSTDDIMALTRGDE
jgi:AbrB family looped-hinge helix DNA binding protein